MSEKGFLRRLYEAFRPPLVEQRKSLTVDAGRGFFGGKGPRPKKQEIKDYYEYYEGTNSDPSVTAAVDSLSDAAVGRGMDLEIDVKEDEEGYEEAERGKKLCEEFNKHHNLDKLIPNIARNMLIAGYLPVETKITIIPEKSGLYLIHPTTVDKSEWNEYKTSLKRIHQKVGNEERWLNTDDLAWFTYNQIGNDPFGQSIIKSVSTLLSYRSSAIVKMDKILDRYSSPTIIWIYPGDVTPLKTAVTEKDAAEDIFIGDVTPDFDLNKFIKVLEIDPQVRFWEYIEYIDRLIFVGLVSPSLFYFKDATEASARVLLEIVDRKVYALGRVIKRVVEQDWFKPLCALNGINLYPKIKWRQKPPHKDLHLPDLISQGIMRGMLYREEYLEILKNLDVTFEVKPELLTPPQRLQPPIPTPLIPQQNIRGESYIVTRLKGEDNRGDDNGDNPSR